MAIMDDHIYQSAHNHHHYPGFDSHFQSYSTPSSAKSSPAPYAMDASYSHAQPHMSMDYRQEPEYHYPTRPPMHQHRSSYSGQQQLHVMTEVLPDHDPADYTAHPLRPNTQYQFRVNDNSSSKQDDDDSSVTSFERSTERLQPFSGLNRPLNHHEQERIAQLDRLKFFLTTAPSRWDTPNGTSDADGATMVSGDPSDLNSSSIPSGHPSSSHPALNRFLLPTQEYVSCVLWNGLYHITGTDIVRALVFRFEAFGRPVKNMKKFEEGVFSDLRNLKPGVDACLEEPKSPFLDLLFKYQCIRTQKKQKVFYWFSVPHDRLFLDALERDLKREKMCLEPTTVITGEPALSFTYDSKKSLYEQFSKAQGNKDGEGELEAVVRRMDETAGVSVDADGYVSGDGGMDSHSLSRASSMDDMNLIKGNGDDDGVNKLPPALRGPNTAFYSMFSLFEGSPTYKQRRKKLTRASRKGSDSGHRSDSEDYQGRGERVLDMGVGYGPTDSAMSAADMFVAQAKGELGPANPDEREKERLRKENSHMRASSYSDLQHMHPLSGIRPSQGMNGDSAILPQLLSRPSQEQRHNTFPLASSSQHPYPGANLRPHALTYPNPASGADLGMAGMDVPQGKTKVFVCPLYSCCRFFKRMEHLKRHMRTHTMERPYQCQRCRKRFSRSDNLNQHIRTHTRADSESGNTSGYDDDSADVESEGVDDLEVEGAYNTRAYPNGLGDLQTPDMKMCEVEVPGNVQDVQGDEEGLVAAPGAEFANGSFYPTQMDSYGNSHLASGAQWATAMNAPSPLLQAMAQLHRSHTPLSSSPAGYMRQSPSVYGSDSEYVTSISAPAHKQMFDHSALYPSHLLENSSGPGPIRRHRSMTPSLIRSEMGRRPMTATGSEIGSPGRGYHPYAVPGYVSQSSSSAQSSPAHFPIPLEYSSSLSRSSSTHRSSMGEQLQDQMHQMLNLDQLDDAMFTAEPASSSGHASYDEIYRTESPLSFGGPPHSASATYASPAQFDKQGMYAPLPDTQSDQFASQSADASYYSGLQQPQHQVPM